MLVAGAVAELAPEAAAGVRLDIEPLHPMFCADRGVIATLGPVEVEVFDAVPWSRPGPEILAAAVAAHRDHVG